MRPLKSYIFPRGKKLLSGILIALSFHPVLASGNKAPVNAAIDDQVWKVRIEGNTTFSDIVIKEIIATEAPTFLEKISFWSRGGHEINETEIRRDVIRIQRYYQRRGFLHVRVNHRVEDGSRSWKKVVYFIIDENAPVRITSLDYSFETGQYRDYITNRSIFWQAQRKHEFQAGNRYQKIKEPDVTGRFNEALKNLGFAYSEVHIKTRIDSTGNTASVTIHCIPGPITYIEDIEIQGVETVSEHYVAREAGFNKGELYRLRKLRQAQREIFNHHLFRFATISIPDQEHDSTLSLDIRIRENPLRSVQAFLGVGTEEIVRGQINWIHRNIAGFGHRFTATARASFREQSLNLDYLFPYIFNTKSSIVVSPFVQHVLERNIYELFHGGITNSFIYRYREDLTGTASYQFTKNLELSEHFDEALPDTTFEYDLSSFQLSGYYSPGFTREQQGWVVQPFAEVSGLLGAAAFSFQKLSIDIRRFTNLTHTTVLATRIQAGSLMNVEQDSLPQNIRFYLGGTSSVRGWNRNQLGPKRARVDSTGTFQSYSPVGGRALFGVNVEIRQELDFFIKGLGIAAFLDGGQIWRDPRDLENRPIQFGVGGGLRYRSPIGPIRIDIGYKLNPTDEDLNIYQGQDFGNALDRIGIHFSVGQAF